MQRHEDIWRRSDEWRGRILSGLRTRRARRALVVMLVAGAVSVVLTALGRHQLGGLVGLAAAAGGLSYVSPILPGPLVALALPVDRGTELLGVHVWALHAVIGGAAVGYLAHLASTRQVARLRVEHWLYALLVGCLAVSILGPIDDSARIRALVAFGALGPVFHSVTTRVAERHARSALLAGLALAMVVEAVYTLYQYLDAFSERIDVRGGAVVYPSPLGTFPHQNLLGQFLVLGGLTVAALAFTERGRLRRAALAIAGLTALALVLTFSRASWIALACGAAIYAVDRTLRLRVAVVGVLAVVATVLLGVLGEGAIAARISTLWNGGAGLSTFRLELAGSAARVVAEHPLTGTGVFREVGVYAGQPDIASHPHNLFLGLAVFFGIPAAIAFALLVARAFATAWRARTAGSVPSRTAVGMLGALTAFLVNGLFEYPFWSLQLTALIVLVLGFALGLGGGRPPARRLDSPG